MNYLIKAGSNGIDTWQAFGNLFNNIVAKIPQLTVGIIVLAAGWWLINILSRKLLRHFHEKEVPAAIKPFLLNFISICLKLILVLCFMQIAGIRMTLFAALIGSLGVAAGLALSGTLQNFTSGIVLLLLKPFKAGDHVITQGKEGTIVSVQLFYTNMLDEDNSITFIPNAKIVNEIIVNLSGNEDQKLSFELKLPYSIPVENSKAAARQALDEFPLKREEHSSFVYVSGLDPDGYKLLIQLWVAAANYKTACYSFEEKLLNKLLAEVKMPGT